MADEITPQNPQAGQMRYIKGPDGKIRRVTGSYGLQNGEEEYKGSPVGTAMGIASAPMIAGGITGLLSGLGRGDAIGGLMTGLAPGLRGVGDTAARLIQERNPDSIAGALGAGAIASASSLSSKAMTEATARGGGGGDILGAGAGALLEGAVTGAMGVTPGMDAYTPMVSELFNAGADAGVGNLLAGNPGAWDRIGEGFTTGATAVQTSEDWGGKLGRMGLRGDVREYAQGDYGKGSIFSQDPEIVKNAMREQNIEWQQGEEKKFNDMQQQQATTQQTLAEQQKTIASLEGKVTESGQEPGVTQGQTQTPGAPKPGSDLNTAQNTAINTNSGLSQEDLADMAPAARKELLYLNPQEEDPKKLLPREARQIQAKLQQMRTANTMAMVKNKFMSGLKKLATAFGVPNLFPQPPQADPNANIYSQRPGSDGRVRDYIPGTYDNIDELMTEGRQELPEGFNPRTRRAYDALPQKWLRKQEILESFMTEDQKRIAIANLDREQEPHVQSPEQVQAVQQQQRARDLVTPTDEELTQSQESGVPIPSYNPIQTPFGDVNMPVPQKDETEEEQNDLNIPLRPAYLFTEHNKAEEIQSASDDIDTMLDPGYPKHDAARMLLDILGAAPKEGDWDRFKDRATVAGIPQELYPKLHQLAIKAGMPELAPFEIVKRYKKLQEKREQSVFQKRQDLARQKQPVENRPPIETPFGDIGMPSPATNEDEAPEEDNLEDMDDTEEMSPPIDPAEQEALDERKKRHELERETPEVPFEQLPPQQQREIQDEVKEYAPDLAQLAYENRGGADNWKQLNKAWLIGMARVARKYGIGGGKVVRESQIIKDPKFKTLPHAAQQHIKHLLRNIGTPVEEAAKQRDARVIDEFEEVANNPEWEKWGVPQDYKSLEYRNVDLDHTKSVAEEIAREDEEYHRNPDDVNWDMNQINARFPTDRADFGVREMQLTKKRSFDAERSRFRANVEEPMYRSRKKLYKWAKATDLAFPPGADEEKREHRNVNDPLRLRFRTEMDLDSIQHIVDNAVEDVDLDTEEGQQYIKERIVPSLKFWIGKKFAQDKKITEEEAAYLQSIDPDTFKDILQANGQEMPRRFPDLPRENEGSPYPTVKNQDVFDKRAKGQPKKTLEDYKQALYEHEQLKPKTKPKRIDEFRQQYMQELGVNELNLDQERELSELYNNELQANIYETDVWESKWNDLKSMIRQQEEYDKVGSLRAFDDPYANPLGLKDVEQGEYFKVKPREPLDEKSLFKGGDSTPDEDVLFNETPETQKDQERESFSSLESKLNIAPGEGVPEVGYGYDRLSTLSRRGDLEQAKKDFEEEAQPVKEKKAELLHDIESSEAQLRALQRSKRPEDQDKIAPLQQKMANLREQYVKASADEQALRKKHEKGVMDYIKYEAEIARRHQADLERQAEIYAKHMSLPKEEQRNKSADEALEEAVKDEELKFSDPRIQARHKADRAAMEDKYTAREQQVNEVLEDIGKATAMAKAEFETKISKLTEEDLDENVTSANQELYNASRESGMTPQAQIQHMPSEWYEKHPAIFSAPVREEFEKRLKIPKDQLGQGEEGGKEVYDSPTLPDDIFNSEHYDNTELLHGRFSDYIYLQDLGVLAVGSVDDDKHEMMPHGEQYEILAREIVRLWNSDDPRKKEKARQLYEELPMLDRGYEDVPKVTNESIAKAKQAEFEKKMRDQQQRKSEREEANEAHPDYIETMAMPPKLNKKQSHLKNMIDENEEAYRTKKAEIKGRREAQKKQEYDRIRGTYEEDNEEIKTAMKEDRARIKEHLTPYKRNLEEAQNTLREMENTPSEDDGSYLWNNRVYSPDEWEDELYGQRDQERYYSERYNGEKEELEQNHTGRFENALEELKARHASIQEELTRVLPEVHNAHKEELMQHERNYKRITDPLREQLKDLTRFISPEDTEKVKNNYARAMARFSQVKRKLDEWPNLADKIFTEIENDQSRVDRLSKELELHGAQKKAWDDHLQEAGDSIKKVQHSIRVTEARTQKITSDLAEAMNTRENLVEEIGKNTDPEREDDLRIQLEKADDRVVKLEGKLDNFVEDKLALERNATQIQEEVESTKKQMERRAEFIKGHQDIVDKHPEESIKKTDSIIRETLIQLDEAVDAYNRLRKMTIAYKNRKGKEWDFGLKKLNYLADRIKTLREKGDKAEEIYIQHKKSQHPVYARRFNAIMRRKIPGSKESLQTYISRGAPYNRKEFD